MLALTGETRRWEPRRMRLRPPLALDGRDHTGDPPPRSPSEPLLTSHPPFQRAHHNRNCGTGAHPTRQPGITLHKNNHTAQTARQMNRRTDVQEASELQSSDAEVVLMCMLNFTPLMKTSRFPWYRRVSRVLPTFPWPAAALSVAG